MKNLYKYALSVLLIGFFLVGCAYFPKSKKPPQDNSPANRPLSTGVRSACEKVEKDSTQTKKFEQGEIIDRFLERHNKYRSWYGLPKLKWENKIAAYAQDWANYLKENKACKMHHRSTLGKKKEAYGENLAWFKLSGVGINTNSFHSSPEKAVHGWTEECKDYNYENSTCTQGEQCGHFTQVVWRDSQKVGCGVATCLSQEGSKDIREELWVCNYDPPGNIQINTPQGAVKKKPY